MEVKWILRRESMNHKVILIGAGPGDVDLLTIKGQEYIRKADCIIFDRLASKDILSFAPEKCEFVFVGKENHHHVMKQENINKLLVEKAKEYETIVRLKGGDPYVFGRGGEEALYLKENGIDVEIIPGVTSVVSVLSSAGIPITHRGLSKGFQVITAHSKRDEMADIDYMQLLDPQVTLVFLMGLAHVEEIADGLISAGRDNNTPAAVISKGTTSYQKRVIGTLRDIGGKTKEAGLESPAIIVVGNVVTLAKELDFFEKRPLFNTRVIVPYIEGFRFSFFDGIITFEESKLKKRLRENGAEILDIKVGRIIPKSFCIELNDNEDNWIVFTSANGIYSYMYNLMLQGMDVRVLSNAKVAVVGKKTAKVLEEFSIRADLISNSQTAEGLFSELALLVDEKTKVFYYGAKDISLDNIEKYMGKCNYKRVVSYVNEPCDYTFPDDIDKYGYVCLTSASSARRIMPRLKGCELNVLSIGPSCSKALTDMGVENYIEADTLSYEGLVEKMIS